MSQEEDAQVSGQMIVIFERSKKVLTRTVKAKAEDKAIQNDNYISPAGSPSLVIQLTFLLVFRACYVSEESERREL